MHFYMIKLNIPLILNKSTANVIVVLTVDNDFKGLLSAKVLWKRR